GVSQVTPPETASVPENETVSAWLYQPFASAPRDGVAVTEGPWASNWNAVATAPLVFPALSLQVPLTETPLLSGPEYVTCVQDAMPEAASLPPYCTVNWWLYQPFESGVRPRVPTTDVGAVASYLSAKEPVAVLPALSVHMPPTDAEPSSGPEYVAWLHEPRPEVPSVPENETVSWWLYQPFASGPRPSVAEASGAVESYASGNAAVPRLPAWSWHEPFTEPVPLSGPE